MRYIALAMVSCVLAGCSPPSPFDEANALLKRGVASDVSLQIDAGSETRHPHIDGTYTVCGNVVLNQPGITVDSHERFLINVHDSRGLGYFDGDRSSDGVAQFEGAWKRLCGHNSANETFMNVD